MIFFVINLPFHICPVKYSGKPDQNHKAWQLVLFLENTAIINDIEAALCSMSLQQIKSFYFGEKQGNGNKNMWAASLY